MTRCCLNCAHFHAQADGRGDCHRHPIGVWVIRDGLSVLIPTTEPTNADGVFSRPAADDVCASHVVRAREGENR